MQSIGCGIPGCKGSVDIFAQRRPQTSPKATQLIVSSEFTVIPPGDVSQHLLSCCGIMATYFKIQADWNALPDNIRIMADPEEFSGLLRPVILVSLLTFVRCFHSCF